MEFRFHQSGVHSARRRRQSPLSVMEIAPSALRALAHPAARTYKSALVADGIPYTSFAVDDVRAEYERLRGQGVVFTQEPTEMGPTTTAVFDDTCGNLIQIAQLT